MVKITNLFALPQFDFFEDWRNFGNPQKFGKFFKLYSTLLVDRLITYTNKIDSSATPA